MNLIDKLPNKVKEGIVNLLYNHPVDKAIIDNLVPESLLPKSIRDKQKEKYGEGNQDNDKENCIQVTTPQGYSVPLCKHDEIFYKGNKVNIWSINPPNIEISFPIKPGLYEREDSFIIKIKDLDMFKE